MVTTAPSVILNEQETDSLLAAILTEPGRSPLGCNLPEPEGSPIAFHLDRSGVPLDVILKNQVESPCLSS